jgi:hypothetical protein
MTRLDLWLRIFDAVCEVNRGRSDTRFITAIYKDANEIYDDVEKRFKSELDPVTTWTYPSKEGETGYTSPSNNC